MPVKVTSGYADHNRDHGPRSRRSRHLKPCPGSLRTLIAITARTTLVDHPCEACQSRPAPNSVICSTCTDQLVSEIAAVGGYHGLAWDLDITIAKQDVFRRGGPGGHTDETPILINEKASDVAAHLKRVLARWAQVVITGTGAERPNDTLSGIASWLRTRARWLAHHQDAAQAHGEIVDAVRAARLVVDRPADRLYVGQCDCGRVLYARPGDRWAVCRAEDHDVPLMWPVDERRTWLMEQAADFVGTTSEIAMALSRYARPVTPSVIRGLENRGRIVPLPETDVRGRKLWRLGDVLDAVAPAVTCEKLAS